VSRVLRPAGYTIDSHFRDESLQTITCTATDYSTQDKQKEIPFTKTQKKNTPKNIRKMHKNPKLNIKT